VSPNCASLDKIIGTNLHHLKLHNHDAAFFRTTSSLSP
ncbi:unnamed protein product, partial [Heterotrigona itama]